MKLCISNIAWDKADDERMYKECRYLGYYGLEIAPSRLFSDNPYIHIEDAREWSKKLEDGFGLKVYSCQSIWYGRSENIFKSELERESLLEYSRRAFCFMEAVGAKNAVFGCPKNRNGFKKDPKANEEIAVEFFNRMADSAAEWNVTLSIEANPSIYGTDFLTGTEETIAFIRQLDHEAVKLNLDIGTMLCNNENLSIINGCEKLIGHIHISEPKLSRLQERTEHLQLFKFINKAKYENAVSIEMGKMEEIDAVFETMRYIYSISKGNEDERTIN